MLLTVAKRETTKTRDKKMAISNKTMKACPCRQSATWIGHVFYPRIIRHQCNNWVCTELPYRGYELRLPTVADYIPGTLTAVLPAVVERQWRETTRMSSITM